MLTFVISFISRPGQVAPASWHPSLTGQLEHFLPLQNSKFSLTKAYSTVNVTYVLARI